MILDTRTLLMMTVLQTLVMGVCMLIIARKGYPEAVRKSMKVWGFAFLVQTAGWLLGGLRGWITDFLSVVVANTLLLGSLAEVYQAIRFYDIEPPRRKFSFTWVVVSLAAMLFFTYVQDNLIARIVVVSLGSALFLGMSGVQLIFPHRSKPGKIRHILGSFFWLSSTICIIRIIFSLSPEASISSFLANSPLQTLVFAGSALDVMVISLGFLLMCTESFNNELVRLAATDDLTGLYNRREIENLSRIELDRAQRTRQPLALLLLDADNFKAINDTCGHLAGDLALQMVANTIKLNLRTTEFIGRLGGDEFVVVMPNTPEETARRIAERLATAMVETPIHFDEKQVTLGVSYGIAMYTDGEPDFTRLVRLADTALYEMKRERVEPTR